MKELTIVVPLFNESSLVDELIKQVKFSTSLVTEDFEIILIDDGSTDSTWLKIKNGAFADSRVRGIKFSRNFGHHYAITAGLHHATAEWVVVMDGDLQDRPEVIPELYRKVKEGFDIVFVTRTNRPEKRYYKIAQKIFYWLLRRLSGLDFDSRQANFSILNKKVVEAFKRFPENARFYSSTIRWLGFNRSEIFADHGKRFSGRPSYTLGKRIKLASDIILSFSERPLRFSIGLGIFISLISLVSSFWFVYRYFFSGRVLNEWIGVITAIFFSTGILLIVIGITGIYVGEIFRQVKNRPLYVIDTTI